MSLHQNQTISACYETGVITSAQPRAPGLREYDPCSWNQLDATNFATSTQPTKE